MMIDLEKLESGLLEVDERERQIRIYIYDEYEEKRQMLGFLAIQKMTWNER